MANISPEKALNSLLVTIGDIIKISKACLLKFDQTQQRLIACGFMGVEKNELEIKLGEGIAGWVAEHGVCTLIDDISQIGISSDKLVELMSAKSILAAPLYLKKSLLGVLVLADKTDNSAFNFTDRQSLIILLPLISWIINNLSSNNFPNNYNLQQLEQQLQLAQAEKEELAHYTNCISQLINCAFLVVDLGCGITHVNKAAEDIFKRSAVDLEGKSLAEILGVKIQRIVKNCTADMAAANQEVSFLNSQGEKITVGLSCCPYYDCRQKQQGF